MTREPTEMEKKNLVEDERLRARLGTRGFLSEREAKRREAARAKRERGAG